VTVNEALRASVERLAAIDRRRARRWLPLALLAAGALGVMLLLATRPEVATRPPGSAAPLVRTVQVELADVQLSVRTHGTVAPRTESELIPEVAGSVVWVSPALVSGGFFEQGEPLLRIDPADYAAALERARATLLQRQSEFERARKDLARRKGLAAREYASAAQLDDSVTAATVADAALRTARAELERAERDHARTEIRAPFAGRVREERVDVGQFVNRGGAIAKLYAIDYAEVRLPVPDDELAHLDLPLAAPGPAEAAGGPLVVLRARFAGEEREWEGRVVRTEGEIDPRSRMVHVVARIDDPYARRAPDARAPLAVGLFVEAEILGRAAEQVAALPRAALRGRDQVFVVDSADKLRFRTVDVLRVGREQVLIRAGLEPGERVCLSPLESAVDGMQVRVAGAVAVEGAGS
jgi:RND family efflux transporter MFP subunit